MATYKIQGNLASKQVQLEVDVVKSDIPLLLSKTTMKNAKVKIDTETDLASIFGSEVPLNITSAGHYCVPFLPPKTGDIVWYKRDRDGKWRGPGKVVFQDGKSSLFAMAPPM